MIDEENIKIIDKKSKFQKSKSFKRKNKFERVGSNDFGNKESLNSKKNLDNDNPKMEKRKSILSIGGGTKKNKNNRRVKFDQKLDDVYKENYKFYKKVNKNPQKKKNSIIKEDPTNEDINSRFKSTKSFKNISKISFSQISNKDSKKNSSKKNSSGNENNKIYTIVKVNKKKNKTIKESISKSSSSKKNSKTIRLDDSSSIHLINDENFYLSERRIDIRSNLSYDTIINNEIYPGEEIKVNKEENLFHRTVNLSLPLKKNSLLKDFNNSIENKSKVDFLLKSLDDNESNKNENSNKISISNSNSIISLSNNLKKESSKELQKNIQQKKGWEKDSLSILNNISFEYESSYENSNLISGQKLINNYKNQSLLKQFLIEEILNKKVQNRNSFFELRHKGLSTTNSSSIIKEKDKEKKIFKKTNSVSSLISKNIKKLHKSATMLGSANMSSNMKGNSNVKRTSSFSENNRKNNLLKINFHEDNSNNDFSKYLSANRKKTGKKPKNKLSSSKNISFYSSLFSNDKNKKPLSKKFSLLSSNKAKRKKDNLLSKINFNILKTSQNLNNPDEFYSNYFHSLLEGGGAQKYNMNLKSMKFIPKSLKEKKSLQKNFTMKNI